MNPTQLKEDVLRSSSSQFLITVQSGLRQIWAQKFRSLLTMLGIVLGVSSLVAMSALVAGMEKGAKEALVAIGGLEKVSILPQGLPIAQRHLSDQAVGITINDVTALQQSAPLVTRFSPEMRLSATLTAKGNTFRLNLYRIQGPGPERKLVAWQPTQSQTFHVPEAFGKVVLE